MRAKRKMITHAGPADGFAPCPAAAPLPPGGELPPADPMPFPDLAARSPAFAQRTAAARA